MRRGKSRPAFPSHGGSGRLACSLAFAHILGQEREPLPLVVCEHLARPPLGGSSILHGLRFVEVAPALVRERQALFEGPRTGGSDGYHENHVHVDLAERVGGHRMCQWDVREPGDEAAQVPLPQPRPASAAP